MKNNTVGQIESPGRRAAAYWFVDGLPEILFGFLFLVPSALVLAKDFLHRQNRWIGWGFMEAIPLLCFVLWILNRRVLNSIKARITYPRTGYVCPPSDFPDKNHPDYRILTLGTVSPADDNVSHFAGRIIPFICFGVFFGSALEARWALPLVMTGTAAGIYFLSRNDVRPYSWHAVLPIALAGFLAAVLDLKPGVRFVLPHAICGTWLLGIGTWTLVRYLRLHPKPEVGQEGR